jgi:hypothetical protein
LNFFKKSLSRADLQINIENDSLTQIPEMIVKELNKINNRIMQTANKRHLPCWLFLTGIPLL